MKILIVKLSSMGDIIHTFPAVTDLLSHHPEAKIDWLVDSSFTDIVALYPEINKIYPFPLRKLKKNKSWALLKELGSTLKQLRKNQYDYIIDPQGLLKTSIYMPYLRSSTYGFDSHSARDKLSSLFYKNKIYVKKNIHAIERTRQLFSLIFNYDIEEKKINYGLLNTLYNTQHPVLFLHGTSRSTKSWPFQNWLNLANLLAQKNILINIGWSNKSELEFVQKLKAQNSNVRIIPKLSLKNFTEVIKKSSCVIGVDTGFTHMSSAFNIPTIGLYNKRFSLTITKGKYVQNIFSPLNCLRKCKKNFCQHTNSTNPECMRKLDYKETFAIVQKFLNDSKTIQK